MNDANVNRAEFIRARVTRRTKDDFDEICRELGKTPTEQMRELVEAFVRAEYGRLRDRLNVHIYHPADYAPEAWRVTMKLRDPTEMTWAGAPIPFPMPTVPMRLVASDDPGYVAITYGPNHMPALWENSSMASGAATFIRMAAARSKTPPRSKWCARRLPTPLWSK